MPDADSLLPEFRELLQGLAHKPEASRMIATTQHAADSGVLNLDLQRFLVDKFHVVPTCNQYIDNVYYLHHSVVEVMYGAASGQDYHH